jgi:membrane-associated phospholipid phosphatase
MLLVQNLARSSPAIIAGSGVLATLITSQPLPLVFSVLSVIFGLLSNQYIKGIFKSIDPKRPEWLRPNPPSDGCGLFAECNRPIKAQIGMPSGHAQTIGFATAFWLMYIWRRQTGKVYKTAIILVLAFLLIYSRVYEGCHSWLQVSVGTLIGSALGLISYLALERFVPNIF